MKLTIHPLTPKRWPDFVRLFGERGVGGGCWCMGWRLPRAQYVRQKGDPNKRAMQKLVKAGPPPGLLAYDGDEPVGWCAVAPREEYAALERSISRRTTDGDAVWSITCVYVTRSHRRRHVSSQLIAAAVDFARSRGAKTAEGYPVPPKPGVTSTNYAYPGFEAAFEAVGFLEIARRRSTRPIVRYDLRSSK